MRFHSLADWLAWQETLHPRKIDLGLSRIRAVWTELYRAALPSQLPFPVITVGGTNGKGSCVAYLEACYRAAGYRCGAYTSPHLLRYNERVRLDMEPVSDAQLCEAFARIDQGRADIPLTYFEFGTLAALDLFVRDAVDVAILEVGLGGRLDATNMIDADVAVVASIGRDHMAWLGDDLASIAVEKAGIFRAGRAAVIGQRDAPIALREQAQRIGARPLQLGAEYRWTKTEAGWDWQGPDAARHRALPLPPLRGRHQLDNAAAVLCALEQLRATLPIAPAAIRQGLLRARLPGRFSVYPGQPTWVLDVAHNDTAAAALRDNLGAYPCAGRRAAVLSLLADKEAEAVVAPLSTLIDRWYLAPAPSDRAMPLSHLAAAVERMAPAAEVLQCTDLNSALAQASQEAAPTDLILVFGSFLTVEAAMRSPILAPV